MVNLPFHGYLNTDIGWADYCLRYTGAELTEHSCSTSSFLAGNRFKEMKGIQGYLEI